MRRSRAVSSSDPYVQARRSSSGNIRRPHSLNTPNFVPVQARRQSYGNERREEQQMAPSYNVPNMDMWGMNIFSLANNQPLIRVVYTAFKSRDLFKALAIPPQTFVVYMMDVEDRYIKTNPFHNSLHAADVTQSANTLLDAPIFNSVFTPLEIAATIFAAAIHDVAHPGVSNQFLINTNSDLALTYNDRSVLENHHLAVAFKLLHQEGNDIFINMTKEQRKTWRNMVIDIVLSTDMAKHNSLVDNFKKMAAKKKIDDSGLVIFNNDSDKLQVLDCLVHCADLSNPTKPLPIYKKWVALVMEEFWLQGDRERKLNMDISPMCDRYTANVGKIQVGFIDFVVKPLWKIWAEFVYPDAERILENLEKNRDYYQSMISSPSIFNDQYSD